LDEKTVMSRIYRKVILGRETNFFYCDACLNEANEPQMGWVSQYVEAVVPGDGNPGVWKEAPLEKCDMCYAVDLEAQEEMLARVPCTTIVYEVQSDYRSFTIVEAGHSSVRRAKANATTIVLPSKVKPARAE
jgi:hypothetical protein